MQEIRQAIKAQAKVTFKANYLMCVAVVFIIGIIVAGVTPVTFGLGSILVGLPLTLGLICFHTLVFHGGTPDFSIPFSMGFGGNFGRKIGGMLWMLLWTMLWSLLFVIPGIVKAYEYSLTPYILANYPDVPAKEALNLSKRMMRGNKWELFVFDLSFIGWILLSALTLGLLIPLYVEPYYGIAQAGYFGELVDRAVRNGVVSVNELNPAD